MARQLSLLLLLGLLALAGPGYPATYYFDSTAGSDSATCTSEGTACKTLTKLNTLTLVGGDTVRLKRGEVWPGTSNNERLLFRAGRSGAEGAPITVTNYGSGALPVIDGPGTAAYGLWCEDSDWLVFDGIEIREYQTGVRLEGCQHIVWKNNISRNTGQTCWRMRQSASGRDSLHIEAFGNQHLGCGTTGNGEGFYIAGDTTVPGGDNSGNVHIHDNLIQDTANECIDIKNTTTTSRAVNVTFERNVCRHNATADADAQRQQIESFGPTGTASLVNHTIRFNWLSQHAGSNNGIRIRGANGLTISRNIVQDIADDGIDFTSPMANTTVSGNTVYASGQACLSAVAGVTTSENLCQGNGSGDTCTGGGNTLVDPANGNFTLPAGSTCLGTGALRPFPMTSGVIEGNGTSLLLTFGVDSLYTPLQCPEDPTDISVASCSVSGGQTATSCQVVGTTQLRFGLATTIAQGETGCTVTIPVNTIEDSAAIGGQYAVAAGLVTPNSANFAVSAVALTNHSTTGSGGETAPNLLTLANMVPGTCAECRADRPWAAVLDLDTTTEAGSAGNSSITSMVGEHDLGASTPLETFRAYCDAAGTWKTQHVTFEYKVNAEDPYTTAVDHQVCNTTAWHDFALGGVSGRYIRITAYCETGCGGVQVRELYLSEAPQVLPSPGLRLIRYHGTLRGGFRR